MSCPDYALGSTIIFYFNTQKSDGTPITLAGSPSLCARIDGNDTEITTGLTLAVDSDSKTGLNKVTVVATSGNGYSSGTNVSIQIAAGTVNGISQIGVEVYAFTIEKQVMKLANAASGGTAAVLTLERAVIASTTSNEPAIKATGNGSGAGVRAIGGATGAGIRASGGATSGEGILAESGGTSGSGIGAYGSGAAAGIDAVGGATGQGIGAYGGATSGAGILATAQAGNSDGATFTKAGSGVDIRGAITGDITGNLSGSAGSVTGAVGSVTGAVGSVTGNVGGNVTGTIGGLTAAALKDFFDTDSATTYASAVAGSVVKEIADNSGGSALTVQDIVDGVWDEDATGHQDQGSFGQAIGDPAADTNTIYKAVVTDAAGATIGADIVDVEGKVDDLESRLGTPSDLGSGATVAANLVDIESQTDDIGVAGAGLTNINLPDQAMNITGDITGNLSGSVGSVTGAVGSVTGAVGSVTGNVGGNVTGSVGSLAAQAKADVNAEVDGAIETYHLDHLLAATYDPASKPGVADALLNELVESDAGVSRFTANALEQAPTGGSAPTAAEIVDEWEAQSQADPTGFHVNVKEWDGNAVTASAGNPDVNVESIDDDVITAGKFDESTAFPLAQADSGATAVARVGADGDTLETLSDQLDAKASQVSVDDLPTNAELATALAAADDAVLAAIAALNNLSATEAADAVLKRDWTAVTGEASRSALNALRFLRNKWSIAGGTLTVTEEDDATPAWTGAVTQTAGDPVSQIDPA